jgi:type VI secretion system protein ImpH
MADPLAPGKDTQGYELFALMRRLECLHHDRPRLGEARLPREEPLRFGQDADCRFAPGEVATIRPGGPGRLPRIAIRAFGLTGPRGPLPATLTEYIRQRAQQAGDYGWNAFLDIFQHRLICLYYRAWAAGQPVIGADRPFDDPFARLLGACTGQDPLAPSGAETRARYYFAGFLAGRQRPVEGLVKILADYFGVPVCITPFVGAWLDVGSDDCTHLGHNRTPLGLGCMLGARVWSRQHRFRLTLGPLDAAAATRFLPDGSSFAALVRWVGDYCAARQDWQLELQLTPESCQSARLGADTRVGRTSWLGRPLNPRLKINPATMQRTHHG